MSSFYVRNQRAILISIDLEELCAFQLSVDHIFNVVSSLFYRVFHVFESRIGLTWWTLQLTGLWGQCERQYASPTPSLYIFLKISKGRRYSYASTYGGAWYSMLVASAEQVTGFPTVPPFVVGTCLHMSENLNFHWLYRVLQQQ